MSKNKSGARERLWGEGPQTLSNGELLALVLRTGICGRSVQHVAEGLLEQGTLTELATAAPADLRDLPGVGPAKAASLMAAFEIGRRTSAVPLTRGMHLRSPSDVYGHFYTQLRQAPQEEFYVMLLDARGRLLRSVMVTRGTLTSSMVHPREVFREALREPAAAIVVVHNHPSGDPTPSSEDWRITRRLEKAGSLLGVPLLDHIVVADGGWSSMREAGVFDVDNFEW